MLEEYLNELHNIIIDSSIDDKSMPSEKLFQEEIVPFITHLYNSPGPFIYFIDLEPTFVVPSIMIKKHVLYNINYEIAIKSLEPHISNNDFTEIYKAFIIEKEYHKEYSYQKHLDNSKDNSFIDSYKSWEYLLRDCYEEVIKGNFNTVMQIYQQIKLIPYIVALMNNYISNKPKERRI